MYYTCIYIYIYIYIRFSDQALALEAARGKEGKGANKPTTTTKPTNFST